MKTKLYYIIFSICCLFCNSCNEELPNYVDITTDVKELIVDLDISSEAVINVTEGNGSYKISNDNEDVLTATVDGNKILLNALQPGIANITITDWARKTQVVKVEVKKLVELELNNKEMTVFIGKVSRIGIYTGNGGYKLSVADDNIVTAVFNEEGEIEVTGKAFGNTTITVTDARDKSATINVMCVNELLLEKTSLDMIFINEPVEIAILNGNGNYICTNNGSNNDLKCEITADNKLIITGLQAKRFNKTVTVSDAAGRSVDVSIIYIDEPYENKSLRYFVKGTLMNQGFSSGLNKGKVVYSPEFNMSQLSAYGGWLNAGYAVSFSGDLSVGNKENAVMYKVSSGSIDKSKVFAIYDCKIEKAEDGWYWISFLEDKCEIRSYIKTSQTE